MAEAQTEQQIPKTNSITSETAEQTLREEHNKPKQTVQEKPHQRRLTPSEAKDGSNLETVRQNLRSEQKGNEHSIGEKLNKELSSSRQHEAIAKQTEFNTLGNPPKEKTLREIFKEFIKDIVTALGEGFRDGFKGRAPTPDKPDELLHTGQQGWLDPSLLVQPLKDRGHTPQQWEHYFLGGPSKEGKPFGKRLREFVKDVLTALRTGFREGFKPRVSTKDKSNKLIQTGQHGKKGMQHEDLPPMSQRV